MPEHHTPAARRIQKAVKIIVAIVAAIIIVIFVGYNFSNHQETQDGDAAPAASANPHSIDQAPAE